MQRIVQEATGAQDWKFEVHKMREVRIGRGDGDGEWCGGWWMVDSTRDKWFEWFKNSTKHVFFHS